MKQTVSVRCKGGSTEKRAQQQREKVLIVSRISNSYSDNNNVTSRDLKQWKAHSSLLIYILIC